MSTKAGEEVMTVTVYIDNTDDARYSKVNKRVENNYLLRKYEYPKL